MGRHMPMRRDRKRPGILLNAPAFLAGLAATALIAGCGDDGVTTVTETVTRTVPQATAERPAPKTTATEESGPVISLADAEATARNSASEMLEMQGGIFTVAPRDWRVSCRGAETGRPWRCMVEQGPCSGTLTIRRVTLGGGLRGIGDVGCIAD
jgi:hypothetical protein